LRCGGKVRTDSGILQERRGRKRFNAEDAETQSSLRRENQEHRQECLCHDGSEKRRKI
jgi:hypothetical protein